MTQTKKGSIAEALANIAVGFAVNFAANWLILPLFGFHALTLSMNFEIGLLYTGISLVRQYVLRRWFNGLKFGHAPDIDPTKHEPLVPAALVEAPGKAIIGDDTVPTDVPAAMTVKQFIENLVALLQQKGVTHIDSLWEVGPAKEHVGLRFQIMDANRPRRLS